MLTALVVGNMVGSGVFLLPAALAKIGTISLYSWGITAVGAIFLALVFAKLSMLFKKSGGPYTYCHEAYGDFIGFQVAYTYWIYIWVGNAAIAVACSGYLSTFWPALAENRLLTFLVTAGFVWTVTIVNAIGVQVAGVFQLVTSLIKLIPLALVIIGGFFKMHSLNFQEFNLTGESNTSALFMGAVLTLWALTGLESASIPAEEAENPQKTIPKATITGTLVSVIFYILSSTAIMGLIPPTLLAHSNSPFSDAARILFGPVGQWIVAIGAIIASLGALNGWVLLQAQIPYAAAKDGLFPKSFSVKSRRGVPLLALFLSSTLVTLLLILNAAKSIVDQFTFIILLATLAALVTYFYTTMAQIILFARQKKGLGKIAGDITIAAIACFYAFWAIYSTGQQMVFYGALLLFTSVPIYARMITIAKGR